MHVASRKLFYVLAASLSAVASVDFYFTGCPHEVSHQEAARAFAYGLFGSHQVAQSALDVARALGLEGNGVSF